MLKFVQGGFIRKTDLSNVTIIKFYDFYLFQYIH